MTVLTRIKRECEKAKGDCKICKYGLSGGMRSICGIHSQLVLGMESELPKDWDTARTEKWTRERDKYNGWKSYAERE